MKTFLFLCSMFVIGSAHAEQFICKSPVLRNRIALDVYHISTDARYVKHYQYAGSGYLLLREITSVGFETSFLETYPTQTMISMQRNGYSAYLLKRDDEKNFRFTDQYAGHTNFLCSSKN